MKNVQASSTHSRAYYLYQELISSPPNSLKLINFFRLFSLFSFYYFSSLKGSRTVLEAIDSPDCSRNSPLRLKFSHGLWFACLNFYILYIFGRKVEGTALLEELLVGWISG